MSNDKKFSMGWYAFALCGGLVSGLLFSRAQYHKGQADAYNDIVEDLEELSSSMEHSLEEAEKKVNMEA